MSSLTGRVFGQYHILDRIGQGGMGTVYRAHDRRANREVAIKFISPAIAHEEVFLDRFRREVKAAARLQHPNIVPVLDYGEQGGYAFLVMPLLAVGTLMDHLKEGPISLDLGAKVLDQVSGALAHAHRHGIIHRDVKPSNILLDQDQNAMLSDFGMARPHDASGQLTGSGLIGTPAYMAPEQVQDGPVDARCDQYALGVVLFYLATGSLPFTGSTPMEYLLKHVKEPFPSARARNPAVPKSVERVIFKATAKSPEDRFGSVSEMNHALQAAIAHARDPVGHQAPTIELPPSVGPALKRPVGRRRWRPMRIAAAIVGALLILAVPAFASGLVGILGRANSPAAETLARIEQAQLTRQAGTIEAMSTELAGSESDPEAIQAAIALTLTAAVPRVDSGAGRFGAEPAFGEAGLDRPTPTPSGTLGAEAVLQVSSPTGTPRSATATTTINPSATSTSQPPSSQAAPSATPTPTGTLTPSSPSPTPSPTRTRTPAPTSAPSSTHTSTPTSTHTPAPTSTHTPAPTSTRTPAPTQNPCSLLNLGGFGVSGNTASWTIGNGSSSSVVISTIELDWPAGNVELDRIRFGSSTIWNGSDDSPPSQISTGLIGNRTLPGGDSRSLHFEFAGQAAPAGYQVELLLDPGCQLSGGG